VPICDKAEMWCVLEVDKCRFVSIP
ncbi:hypothetical protein A2U01_0097417, partial [Trifolium medium]|nr:hypothetical protein [Trifolium medium]